MGPAPDSLPPSPPSPPEPREPRGRAAPLILVVVAFVLSRQMYWHEGVFFDVRMLGMDWAIHFIELPLLRERLWESLYYLHSQPPLYNLYLGAVVNLFGESAGAVFAWSYTGMGLLLALSLYGLMVRMRVPRWPSALLTVLFMVSPATVLFENWLFYIYPETLLLCASALCFHRFVSTGRAWAGVLLFAVLGMLALVRSAYHLVWYLGMMGLVLGVRSGPSRRTVLLTAAGPLLLILALYTKNALYFGTFSGSSWLGINLSRVVLEATPLAERQELVREGLLPPLALQKSLQPLSAFPPQYQQVEGPTCQCSGAS